MITTLSDQSDATILAAIDAYTPEQVFKATLVQCLDVIESDGGLFAEDYFEGDYETVDDDTWNDFANDFNNRMLRALVDIPLDDVDAREFLLTAFGAGARCTLRVGAFDDDFKSLIQGSAQAVCYHLSRATSRQGNGGKAIEWKELLDEARGRQHEHSAGLQRKNEVGGLAH